jgi:IclR family KDG regulon transcriptional repressor
MPTQSVDRAIAVLTAYSIEEPVLGVTQLSQRLGLHKSTVHRLLTSLEHGGLMERDPRSRKYRLGMRLIELGNTVLGSRRLPQVVLPYLRYLADTLEEVAYLAVQIEGAAVTVLQVPAPELTQSVSWVARSPLNCSSTGKVFLAYMPEKELERYLKRGLPRKTAKTITDPVELRREVERIREQGFATAFEEFDEGENAVAVPITEAETTLVGAIGVVGPTYRFTKQKVEDALDIVKSVGRKISRTL